MKHLGKLAVLGAVLAASAPFASAQTSVTPGGGSVTPAIVAAPNGMLVTTDSGTFNNPPPDYVATYSESVFRGGTGECASCLEFEFTVTDTSGAALSSNTITDFLGFVTSVGIVGQSGTGTPLNLADVTASESGGGSINFNYDSAGDLQNGDSITFVAFTNAPNYAGVNLTANNGVASNTPDLGPSNATPEPSSLLLLGTGLLGTAGLLVRKRQTA